MQRPEFAIRALNLYISSPQLANRTSSRCWAFCFSLCNSRLRSSQTSDFRRLRGDSLNQHSLSSWEHNIQAQESRRVDSVWNIWFLTHSSLFSDPWQLIVLTDFLKLLSIVFLQKLITEEMFEKWVLSLHVLLSWFLRTSGNPWWCHFIFSWVRLTIEANIRFKEVLSLARMPGNTDSIVKLSSLFNAVFDREGVFGIERGQLNMLHWYFLSQFFNLPLKKSYFFGMSYPLVMIESRSDIFKRLHEYWVGVIQLLHDLLPLSVI